MAEIVASVLAALHPLVAAGVVSEVRMVGLEGADSTFKPIVSISVSGERPETHATEISRLVQAAGLDVQWTLNTAAPAHRMTAADKARLEGFVVERPDGGEPPAS